MGVLAASDSSQYFVHTYPHGWKNVLMGRTSTRDWCRPRQLSSLCSDHARWALGSQVDSSVDCTSHPADIQHRRTSRAPKPSPGQHRERPHGGLCSRSTRIPSAGSVSPSASRGERASSNSVTPGWVVEPSSTRVLETGQFPFRVGRHLVPGAAQRRRLLRMDLADVYVQSSKVESLGLSVLDATRHGIPCVVTRTGRTSRSRRHRHLRLRGGPPRQPRGGRCPLAGSYATQRCATKWGKRQSNGTPVSSYRGNGRGRSCHSTHLRETDVVLVLRRPRRLSRLPRIEFGYRRTRTRARMRGELCDYSRRVRGTTTPCHQRCGFAHVGVPDHVGEATVQRRRRRTNGHVLAGSPGSCPNRARRTPRRILVGGGEVPESLTAVLDRLGLGDDPLGTLTAIAALVGGGLLLLKSAIYALSVA